MPYRPVPREIAVRLTLRTLLAYLDDTLEPAEIKHIGQKVAESDAAQELVARIKQVTRKRRLTAPPATGPGARFDPNTVADYLDNELPADQVAELEKTCLESDVHLAEVASCHQILTLVLGEPALVPPTARERMYGLVHGREAIPFRKASAAARTAPDAGADGDADETLLLGLPFYRRHGTWLRWALPLAGLLLLAALGIALWQTVPRPHEVKVATAVTGPPGQPESPKDKGKDDKGKDDKGNEDKGKDDKGKDDKGKDDKGKDDKGKDDKGKDDKGKDDKGAGPSTNAPSTERAAVGKFLPAFERVPTVLVQSRQTPGAGWERVRPEAPVWTTDRLVSLPGYASELRLDSGVRLLLRGHIPQFSTHPLMDLLLESAVVLYQGKDFDADLTLQGGRLYLSNHKDKGPAKVRLRFDKEVWDLTLEEPGTEVGVDLLRVYTDDINYQDGEEPRADLYLCVLRGSVNLKVDIFHFNLHAPPGPAIFHWDNKGPGPQQPQPLKEVPAVWNKQPPQTLKLAKEMTVALEELSERLARKQRPEVILLEGRQKEQVPARLLAIYALCALDEVTKLIEILGDEDHTHVPDREAAIFALRHWLSRGAEQGPRLYDVKARKGLLMDSLKYRSQAAETIFVLLHDLPPKGHNSPDTPDRDSRETYEFLADSLCSKQVAIAELAWYHLRRLAQRVPLPPFNAGFPLELRQKSSAEVKKLIDEGKLPPAPPTPPPGKEPGPKAKPGP
jgi:hypothetical protein